MQIPKIKSPSCIGGENPMWDVISERLYYIDNVGRKVQSLDPAAGATTTLEMPGVPPSNEVATGNRLMRAAFMSSMELERAVYLSTATQADIRIRKRGKQHEQ